jgi:hypothetical protein
MITSYEVAAGDNFYVLADRLAPDADRDVAAEYLWRAAGYPRVIFEDQVLWYNTGAEELADVVAEPPAPDEPPEPPAEPPEPPGEPAVAGTMWVDVSTLPATGAAWDNLLDDANASWKAPNLADQNNQADISVFAGALVAARTSLSEVTGEVKASSTMRAKVVKAIEAAVGTEGDRTLALGRQITGYVLAADLIGYRTDAFEDWLADLRHQTIDSKTLISTHEERPNNWGTHAGMARVAIALYLGDTDDLERAVTVFRGWLGDRNAYAGFDYGDLSWQSDRSNPVGVNPAGATIDGHDVDGVLPDDQRRGGSFSWPPSNENYAWEAMQGAVSLANLLARNGYPDVWDWSDAAIWRAARWLIEVNDYIAVGDDEFILPMLDRSYGTSWWDGTGVAHGKSISFTDWTHAA